MRTSYRWPIRHEWGPSHLLGPVASLGLVRNNLFQGALTWAASLEARVPLAGRCFLPTRQVDDSTGPDATSKFSYNSNQVRTKLYYASRSGNDASELLSSTGLSSLTAQKERKVSAPSARRQPRLSSGDTSMEQLSRRARGELRSPHPRNPTHCCC